MVRDRQERRAHTSNAGPEPHNIPSRRFVICPSWFETKLHVRVVPATRPSDPIMPRAELAAVRLEQLKLCEYSLRLTLPRSKGELTGCGVIVAIPYSTTQLYPVRVLRRWQLASVGRTASGVINRDQDLSGIRVGLHDEIFQGAMPVLVGVGAASTYSLDRGGTSRRRYPGRAHLLETTKQGLTPDCTIADAGQGL